MVSFGSAVGLRQEQTLNQAPNLQVERNEIKRKQHHHWLKKNFRGVRNRWGDQWVLIPHLPCDGSLLQVPVEQ